jgi:hypothetical protein
MAVDKIEDLEPEALAKFYLRIADGWEAENLELSPALAPLFLRVWIANRIPNQPYWLDAPPHLRSDESVTSVLQYHRRVF